MFHVILGTADGAYRLFVQHDILPSWRWQDLDDEAERRVWFLVEASPDDGTSGDGGFLPS